MNSMQNPANCSQDGDPRSRQARDDPPFSLCDDSLLLHLAILSPACSSRSRASMDSLWSQVECGLGFYLAARGRLSFSKAPALPDCIVTCRGSSYLRVTAVPSQRTVYLLLCCNFVVSQVFAFPALFRS